MYSLCSTVCLGLDADKDSLVESLLDAVRNHKQEMESEMERKKINVMPPCSFCLGVRIVKCVHERMLGHIVGHVRVPWSHDRLRVRVRE